MGTMNAMGMAEAVQEGSLDLDTALVWHLSANHFPPISEAFLPVAKQAIDLANDDDWDTVLTMPNGRDSSVGEIVEGMHLSAFLAEQADDLEDDDE